ncbi:hypothetical protein FPY71_14580 [Aureimonas fodinaquatilis]|uniref:Uncharacterized protein n=1 Tax=Aureimonas fodinaquatilis TaxID=2565783 RepID=A0A5B0DX07_9HYPH|nr:hypothetical protein [Aureimonas fodinaquatilis]KAA0969739.1 hypothetical protein FPY71_14580 [Aureimonas fodinaquatilis]
MLIKRQRICTGLATCFLFAALAPALASDEAAQMFPEEGQGNQVGLIAGICAVQLKDMSPEGCQCLAEQSLVRLSDPQRDYMIATVISPPAAERMLGDQRVGQADQKVIFDFLNDSLTSCETGTYNPDAQVPPSAQ